MSKRERIDALGQTNPIVRAWLDVHRFNQGYSFELALEEMVIALATSNNHLLQSLADVHSRTCLPVVLIKEPS